MTDYPRPIATVDIVLLTKQDGALHVGLIERDQEPFAGMLALPGGFIHLDKDRSIEDGVRRVLRDKAGLRARYMEQLKTFGGPSRDPRGWSLSVAYFVLVQPDSLPKASLLRPHPITKLPRLAFDHRAIIDAGVERLRSKSTYSALPAYLLAEKFTMAELQTAYELCLGRTLGKTPFRTKILDREIIEQVDSYVQRGSGRPAQLYRIKPGRNPEFDGVI